MAELTIADVPKAYGATPVMHGVSNDIADGEFVILVGRRAAGNRPCYG